MFCCFAAFLTWPFFYVHRFAILLCFVQILFGTISLVVPASCKFFLELFVLLCLASTKFSLELRVRFFASVSWFIVHRGKYTFKHVLFVMAINGNDACYIIAWFFFLHASTVNAALCHVLHAFCFIGPVRER